MMRETGWSANSFIVSNRSRVEGDKRTESIEPRRCFPGASVEPTDARKDSRHAHAVGGAESGGTSPDVRHAGKL